jgi:hypothetical protein
MKLLYKPFEIAAKMVGKRIGKTAFAKLWERLGDPAGPPKPTTGRQELATLAGAAAVEAATLAAVGAVIDQLAARVFHHLFGAWPGKQPAAGEGDDADSASPAAAVAAG